MTRPESCGDFVVCPCRRTGVMAYERRDRHGRLQSVTYKCRCGKSQTVRSAPARQQVAA